MDSSNLSAENNERYCAEPIDFTLYLIETKELEKQDLSGGQAFTGAPINFL